MATIPRGVQEISWKNKHTKGTQIRYRVRVNRKKDNIKVDELFDTLKDAIDFLNDTKSKKGIVKIIELTEQEKEENRKMNEFINSPPFSYYVDTYIKSYINIKDDGSELKKRNIKSDTSRIKTILNTELEHVPDVFSNLPTMLLTASKNQFKKRQLKSFKLEEIDDVVITNYIKERLRAEEGKKIPSLGTVKREVDTLSVIFNKIRYIDKKAFKEKLHGMNPCATYDRSLLEGFDVRIKQRIKPELEDKIIETLKAFENKEMLLIFGLAMATGMRRSELLRIKWEDIDKENRIVKLYNTKGRKLKGRDVHLNDAAISVIETIPKIDDKLFHYTIDGFAANWTKIKKRSGFKEVRWHDTRREFVTKVLLSLKSSIVITEMLGMKDVKHFEKSYMEEESNLESQKGLMKSIGNEDVKVTKGYFVNK
ncbi:site-specific integrase [Rugamonas sp. A1-17]|nr:site-specific integrase [Rugamonas sp. A1-17]